MGYTHYWFREQGPGDKQAFEHLSKDVKRIIEQASYAGIPVGDWAGQSQGGAEFTQTYFSLNGVGSGSMESFIWETDVTASDLAEDFAGIPDECKKLTFFFCKTGLKPYDAVVTAVLLRAKDVYGDGLKVMSDGEWFDWLPGRVLYEKTFGIAPTSPFFDDEEETL